MMVPHHHHESLALKSADQKIHEVSHSHKHNGVNHHHHDHEEENDEDENGADHNVPKHLHFSASGNFDFLRINNVSTENELQVPLKVSFLEVFCWELDEPAAIDFLYDLWPDIMAKNQCKPGANSLRGPPSIA